MMEMNDFDNFSEIEDDFYESSSSSCFIRKSENSMQVSNEIDDIIGNIMIERCGKFVRTIQYKKVPRRVVENFVSELKKKYPSSNGYTIRSK